MNFSRLLLTLVTIASSSRIYASPVPEQLVKLMLPDQVSNLRLEGKTPDGNSCRADIGFKYYTKSDNAYYGQESLFFVRLEDTQKYSPHKPPFLGSVLFWTKENASQIIISNENSSSLDAQSFVSVEQHPMLDADYKAEMNLKFNSIGLNSIKIKAFLRNGIFKTWRKIDVVSCEFSSIPPKSVDLQCDQIDGEVPAGTICKTSKKTLFQRKENAWKDLGVDGQVWSDVSKEGLSGPDAARFCADNKLIIPSIMGSRTNNNWISHYGNAELHGLREVFKDLSNKYFHFYDKDISRLDYLQLYTLSSRDQRMYSGQNGEIYTLSSWVDPMPVAVRCIER